MNIIFKGRHTEVLDRFRKHATAKLSKLGKLEQRAIRIDVEVSTERNPRQSGRRERVELTIASRGPAIRAEAAAEDRYAALDMAITKLESRLRRAGDRRKCRHGAHSAVRVIDLPAAGEPGAGQPDAGGPVSSAPAGALDAGGAADGQPADDVVPIEMQGDGPLVVREKFHVARPMTIDQALFEMELVGHDFFLFRDTEDGRPSVVYRRRGYQYGVIRLVEDVAEEAAGPPPGDGALSRTNGRAEKAAELAAR
ncbi:MAG TPA: ribosome-associated translation inhibitor RaiA [Streptosporangiaceae bacterium]|nr:ribosome-associated translation inhibitor RaiA [Streptosporangiaceae bacterium]